MSDIVVHSVPGSPYGRAVLMLLEERRAPYRLAPVAPGTAGRAPHLGRHPFGRVPVIEHEGFTLYETQAILRYLDRTLPGEALMPSQARAAARMDQLMNICDWYLMQGVNNVIGFHRIVGPRLFGLVPDEAAIAAAMPKAHALFNELSRLLGKASWFVEDRMTLADILLAPHMDFLAATPEWPILTEGTGNLVLWMDGMRTRPGFQATSWEKVAAMAKADA